MYAWALQAGADSKSFYINSKSSTIKCANLSISGLGTIHLDGIYIGSKKIGRKSGDSSVVRLISFDGSSSFVGEDSKRFTTGYFEQLWTNSGGIEASDKNLKHSIQQLKDL